MKLEQLYLSTIASDIRIARQYGIGVEIAEYCTACNMDEYLGETDASVQAELEGVFKRIFHAPFNELFPCAIDPKARELAQSRFLQAMQLAKQYGATKMVVHGGYNPWMYFPSWYTEQSILFWRNFLRKTPGIEIVLENVMEKTPELLLDIIKQVDSPYLRMCLDIGHANVYSEVSAVEWLTACAPYISHFHIHNNDGTWDTHSALNVGSIPMEELLILSQIQCPNATYTLEVREGNSSIEWLMNRGLI